jgi:hypothetical protein
MFIASECKKARRVYREAIEPDGKKRFTDRHIALPCRAASTSFQPILGTFSKQPDHEQAEGNAKLLARKV